MADVKRIALFLDGTWNNVNDNTNVWRLKSLCTQSPEQAVYYSAGVGTDRSEHLTGGLFGIGINEEVTNAYQWLVEHYETDAKIFIFGFSRGAFTARSLAGLVSKCGLLKPGSPVSVKQLYARYGQTTMKTVRELAHVALTELSQEEQWIVEYSRAVPIFFQGVWDTVGSLGMPIPLMPNVSREDFAFLETDLRISYKHAYHALAIDEHRKAFAPTLWNKRTLKQGESYPPRPMDEVEQRWFVGAHANVGGGYADDLLAQIPLQWLMKKAEAHGLEFKDTVVIDGNENTCQIHDSLAEMAHGFYEFLTLGEHFYRTIGAPPFDSSDAVVTTINETIDATVFDRWRSDNAYRPKNLQEWASRRRIDPATITASVNAQDLTPTTESKPGGTV